MYRVSIEVVYRTPTDKWNQATTIQAHSDKLAEALNLLDQQVKAFRRACEHFKVEEAVGIAITYIFIDSTRLYPIPDNLKN